MRRKIICIVGPSGSGKTTLANIASKELNIPTLCSYTTRPKRENEINGIDHFFVTKEEMPTKDKMLAYTKFGDYEYWASIEQIPADKPIIYVIDEKGLMMLMEEWGDRYEIDSILIKRNKGGCCMSRIILTLLFSAFFIFPAACSACPEELPEQNTTRNSILTVYFSCTCTTKAIAEKIASITGSDIYGITPEDPYTEEDLAYYTGGRADQEQADPSVRPLISGNVEDMDGYDTIILGYPIWHGEAPRIINTFLESYDLSGKTILPFCTSHSSGIGSSDDRLHSSAPSATWLSGVRFPSGVSDDEIRAWLESEGISMNKRREFNFDTHTVMLNSGYEMPINGIGTYSLLGDECYGSIRSALSSGVRLIDTAYMYHNEEEIGRAIRDSGIPRDEIFVITKIYPSQFGNPEEAIELALEKLDIGYIDIMLLHHPGNGDVNAYHAMEEAVKEGKIRSIGLSNWYVEELEEFLPQIDIMPALVQNEIHPYYQENDVIPFIQNLGIVVQGWYPLGGRGHTAELLSDPVISAIAQSHGVSSAQVILRWNLQKGVVVIPGSSNPDHIKENTELYHFELSEEEMAAINALDRNEKHDWY